MQNNANKVLVGAVVVLAIAVAYLLFSARDSETRENGGDNGTMEQEAVTAPAAVDYMKPQIPAALTDMQKDQLKSGASDHAPSELTFNIAGGSFYFAPNEIRVKKGDKVKIVFTNAGGTHNLILDEFQVKTGNLKTGESETVEFTADKSGTFEFYCSIGNGYHRQMGQIGVLIVE